MGFWRDVQDQQTGGVAEPVAVSRGPSQQVVIRGMQAAVDSAYNELKEEHAEAADEAAEEVRTLSEVERRLRKSNCYRAILDQPLFDDNASDEALEVEAEFREFALSRLRELMGIDSPKQAAPPALFSPEEQIALKAWAGKLMGKPAIFSVEAAPTRPTTVVVSPPRVQPAAPVSVEPRVRTIVDPDALQRRGAGRPRGSRNKPKTEQLQPPTQPQALPASPEPKSLSFPGDNKILTVEGTKLDGTRGIIEVNMSRQVQPQGVQRAPMPSPQMALATVAVEAEAKTQSHPVVQQLLTQGK